jgi:hypothetical protein
MKENKNKHLRNIANKIAKLELQMREGKNVKLIEKEIYDIMCSLSFEEMNYIDEYISRKKLLTK